MIVKSILFTAVLPPAVSFGLGWIGWRLSRRDGWRATLAAVAVVAGYGVTHAAITGWSLTTEWGRLPWLMLGGVLAGALLLVTAVPKALSGVLLLLFAALASVFLVPSFPDVAADMAAWRLGLAGLIALTAWAGYEGTGPDRSAAGLLWVCCIGAASVLLLMAGHANFSQLAGGLSAALGAAWFLSVLLRNGAAMRVVAPAAAVGLTGLLASGWFNNYSDVPIGVFVMVAVAPVGLLLRRVPIWGRRPRWQYVVVQAAVVLAPVGWSLSRALTVYLRETSSSTGYGY